MQLVSAGSLLPPNVCFICETYSPDGVYVDTLRNHQPGVFTPLTGRKYLCESCVKECALQFGLVSDNDVRIAQLAADQATDKLKYVRNSLNSFLRDLSELVQGEVLPEEVPAGVSLSSEEFLASLASEDDE